MGRRQITVGGVIVLLGSLSGCGATADEELFNDVAISLELPAGLNLRECSDAAPVAAFWGAAVGEGYPGSGESSPPGGDVWLVGADGGLWQATDDERSAEPAMSPDAAWVYFTKSDGDYTDETQPLSTELWAYDVQSAESVKLFDARGVADIAVSPDGTRLAFTGLDRADQQRLFFANVAAPYDITMADAPSGLGPWQVLRQPGWSPDGTAIVYVDDVQSPDKPTLSELRVLDVASGADQSLHQAPANADLMSPHWLADGQHIAVTVPNPQTLIAPRQVIVIDHATGTQTTVADGLAADAELASTDATTIAEIGYGYTEVDGVGDVTGPPVLRTWHNNTIEQAALPSGWAYAADLSIAPCTYRPH